MPTISMLPKATEVQPLSNYRLLVTFDDGARKVFDMTPYLDYPVFQRLKNPGFFGLARIDYGTVTWPGEIDIAPETIYLEAISENPCHAAA